MNFAKDLGKLKIAIDRELEHQLDLLIRDALVRDPLIADALKQIKLIAISGGKRIRGALLAQAYFGVGGQEKKKILKAAAAIELVHLFLLVHDDIIDRGNLRHGKQTLHAFFGAKLAKKIDSVEAAHMGNSIAIIVGDLLYAQALKIILEAGFESGNAIKAVAHLQAIVTTTIVGQSQDLTISFTKNIQEKQILAMYENKTARYTFEGPLQIGAMLGGCFNAKMHKALSNYSLPLGIAFQIQDDILSMFGSAKQVGKSGVSDIEEGKKTLLVWKSFNKASAAQKKVLDSTLGKRNITSEELKNFQAVIEQSGALAFCQSKVSENLAEGKKAVAKLILLPEAKKFLLGLVEYLQQREI